jgi:hypothetical protein
VIVLPSPTTSRCKSISLFATGAASFSDGLLGGPALAVVEIMLLTWLSAANSLAWWPGTLAPSIEVLGIALPLTATGGVPHGDAADESVVRASLFVSEAGETLYMLETGRLLGEIVWRTTTRVANDGIRRHSAATNEFTPLVLNRARRSVNRKVRSSNLRPGAKSENGSGSLSTM